MNILKIERTEYILLEEIDKRKLEDYKKAHPELNISISDLKYAEEL